MTGTDFQPAAHHQRARSMTSTGDCVGNNLDGESPCGEMGYETYSQEQTLYNLAGQWTKKAMQGLVVGTLECRGPVSEATQPASKIWTISKNSSNAEGVE